MTEIIFEGTRMIGFNGAVVRRRQPGIHVPHDAMGIFKPIDYIRNVMATIVRVERKDDPGEWFVGRVARANSTQSIIHVLKDSQAVFTPGTECFVRLATEAEIAAWTAFQALPKWKRES